MSTVMIMAGGTGGHVFPALAVAQALRAESHEVTWMGTRNGLEAAVVPAAGFEIDWVSVSGLRGKGFVAWMLAPFKLLFALVQSLVILRRRQPQVVLGMGGFVSGPGGLAARILHRPLVIHEQNAVAGMTNRWLSRIATTALEAFPYSFPHYVGASLVGNPLRENIAALNPPETRLAERAARPKLLIVGGSQGALILNKIVPEAVGLLAADERPLIWHQAGEQTEAIAREAYVQAGIDARVDAFIVNMAEAYAWADLVICRAGALTVSELAAAGLPAIFVPFPSAVDDHQTHNARYLVDANAGLLLPQDELTAENLSVTLRELLANRKQLEEMAERARARAMTDSTMRVKCACLSAAPRKKRR